VPGPVSRLLTADHERLVALLGRAFAAPEVPVHPHVDSPLVVEATRRALVRAGYDPTTLGL
jgi:hypothetical protein